MGPSPTSPDPATPASVVEPHAGSPTAPTPPRGRLRGWWQAKPPAARVAAVAGALSLFVVVTAWAGTGYVYAPFSAPAPQPGASAPDGDRGVKLALTRERARGRQLQARLKATRPRGVYIVVDQTHNRLYLKKDDAVLLEASCSAGSGMVLKESGGKQREWVFDTPRGRFQVLSMAEHPVWRKPDWAFVEEGTPIPKNPAERFEYGTLGEYALYFGNGYMIHGTLYERLLGRAVSHGCIRVGRDDLRKVWANARLGMPIFIY